MRKKMLHSWYIDEGVSEEHGKYFRAHGVVTGHERLPDSTWCHTSRVVEVQVDDAEGELVVQTRNTRYHCPLNSCDWDAQDRCPEAIPDYSGVKARYRGRKSRPSIEPGKVLLVLSNFCLYYFHSLYYVPEGAPTKGPCDYRASEHIGMMADSFLITAPAASIDLRYFPHYGNVEFYTERTNGKPLFLENIGDVTLIAQTSVGLIELKPGERKEVKKENVMTHRPVLSGGDLYPAEFLG